MTVRDIAFERRARIRGLLSVRTQEQPILTAMQILKLLGSPPGLAEKTVARDVLAIRAEKVSAVDKCPAGSVSTISDANKSELNGFA